MLLAEYVIVVQVKPSPQSNVDWQRRMQTKAASFWTQIAPNGQSAPRPQGVEQNPSPPSGR